jgi:hypothetical protein
VVAILPTANGGELWKYSRYFDNPQFWTKPFEYDVSLSGRPIKKKKPVKPEFEMYNVSQDPLEKVNLAHASNRQRDLKPVQQQLEKLLEAQRQLKRLYPEPMRKYIEDIKSSE